jgi:hypothetical protein
MAKDDTRKFLVGFNTKMDPKAVVETVLIPEAKRSTLCVSSQIGCSLSCSFCHTGTQKLERSLTSGEGRKSNLILWIYKCIKLSCMVSGWTVYDCSREIR